MLKRILNDKIVKSGMWYTVSNFFLHGINFLTIPIFTRLLSTSDYGLVALYKAWVTIFMVIISLSLTESIRRAKYDYEANYDEFASSIAFLSLIIFLVYFIIFIIANNMIQSITGLSKSLLYLMIFHAFFVYIREFAITKLRFEYKYKAVSIISVLSVVLGVILSVILIKHVFVKDAYLGKIIGDVFFIILTGGFFLFYLLSKGKTFIKFDYWKYALSISTPLVIHNLSKIINDQFDRVIINKYLGQSATGIYSFSYSIGAIITVISISLGQAWEPWFFQKFNKNDIQIIKKRAEIYRDVFTLIYICVLMVSTELVKIIANENYWGGISVIPWVFLGLYFQFLYSFEVNVEFALKKTKLISLGTIFAVLINIVLNLLFIPTYGYIAAAITTAISYFVLFLLHYFLTSRIIGKKIYGLAFHLKSICYVMIATIYFIIFQENIFIRFLAILIAVLLFYRSISPLLNKDENNE
ncbi:MAG TPA: hypothetical protein DCM59_18125 [Clostridium sp.]|nr:hypothetical protein [Clostridium sp.]